LLKLLAGDEAVREVPVREGVVTDVVLRKLATRWAVEDEIAAICIGGSGTGSLFFFGSVEDKV